jgi:hypothetical protein
MSNRKFERACKKAEHFDSLVSQNKKAHKEEGVPLDQNAQVRFARAAFECNQYGDGDNWSYDDVGKYGYDEVVKLQDQLNAGKGLGYNINKRATRKFTP